MKPFFLARTHESNKRKHLKANLSIQGKSVPQSRQHPKLQSIARTTTKATMNSLELAYQMRRMALDNSCSDLPPPPHTLDCSGFDKFNSMSSFNSYESQLSQSQGSAASFRGKSLSRSRCVTNLSAMGSVSSEGSGLTRSSVPKYEAGPNAWGYFVDSVES